MFLRFSTKWGFLNSISEVSAWFLNKKNTWKLHETLTSFVIILLLIQNYYIKEISLLKKISLALSFHEKAESAMSRISDVVNKIM